MNPINIDGTGGEEDERRREEAAQLLRESGIGQALGRVQIDPAAARRAEAQQSLSGVDSALAGIRAPQMQGAAPPMQRDVVPPRPMAPPAGGGLASQLGDPRRAGRPLPAPSAPDKRAQAAQVFGAAGLADPRGEEAEREAQLAALRAMYAKGPTR